MNFRKSALGLYKSIYRKIPLFEERDFLATNISETYLSNGIILRNYRWHYHTRI